jgi:hypothetical protein
LMIILLSVIASTDRKVLSEILMCVSLYDSGVVPEKTDFFVRGK